MKFISLKHLVIGLCMFAAAGMALALKPTIKVADVGPKIDLEVLIPKAFGDWKIDETIAPLIANPEQEAIINKIYNQTLTRTYVNAKGERIMLSIAYGGDQSDSMAMHKPEVCYPAQGFNLRANVPAQLNTPFGPVPVRRLDTQLGARLEPVTYWFAFGDQVVSGRFEQRLAELRLGLAGRVPHGLVFRVSSIDADTQGAYREQDRFVNELLVAMSVQDRGRVFGLASQL